MSNVLDVLLTYDIKSSMCVVVVVTDHHVGNNRFNLVLAKIRCLIADILCLI